MTISSTTRVAGPFTGNGSTSVFPFAFKVFADTDVAVIRIATSNGAITSLSPITDYTVDLNPNQDANPGGSVTLVAGALATGSNLLIKSAIPDLQPIDLTNQGGFYPEVLNNGFDRATAQVQQVQSELARSIRTPESEPTANLTLPPAAQRGNQSLGFDAAGNILVGGTFPSLVYYGPANDPSTRSNGSPLQVGDLHFNTVSDTLKVWDGSQWLSFNSAATDGVRGDITISGGGSVYTATSLAGVTGSATFLGGMTSRPNATVPTSNIAIGPSAGLLLNDAAENCVAIGSGALDQVRAGDENIAIGTNALGSLTSGAVAITNTAPGSGGTPGTITGVTLEKDSGTGTMTVYPTVTLTVDGGGAVTAVSVPVATAGSGATVRSGIVFKATSAGIALGAPADWRGTLAAVTGRCTAVGSSALASNTTGFSNTAVGRAALGVNTTGSTNTAVGEIALLSNTSGGGNVGIGQSALLRNTTGSQNTAVGWGSLGFVLTGNNCTAVGHSALLNTTSGANTAVGSSALASNTTGFNNVAVGIVASQLNTTGTSNCAVGANALFNNTTGSQNVAIGSAAGLNRGSGTDTLTSATSSVFIGHSARAADNGQTNQVVIAGTNGLGDGSNTTVIGNSSTTSTRLPGGNLTLTAGDVIVADGNGIDFSATANGAGTPTTEKLTDYEEGTWVPVYEAATGSFTTLTMDVVSAKYTKIGKMVIVNAHIRTDNVSIGTASGNLYVAGLPYAQGATTEGSGHVSTALAWSTNHPSGLRGEASATRMQLTYRNTAGNAVTANTVASHLTTGATADRNELVFTATYWTA